MPKTSQQAIADLVYAWFDLLAEGRYADALGMVDLDPYAEWTPQRLQSLINGDGMPCEAGRTIMRVTDWRTARAVYQSKWNTVEFLGGRKQEGKVVGAAFFNLPLNGKWSDVTALFHILQNGDALKLKFLELQIL